MTRGKNKEKADESPPLKSGRKVVENKDDDSDEGEIFPEEEGGIVVGDIYIPPAPPAVCSIETTGPRLIITDIEAENFKSYAGKQHLGPFHKSFTSVIGPNGSGKSNVIDSMLFVFGYKASKIRSKKIAVLIHKSPKFQNVTSCSVRVNFALIIDKPNDSYEEVPNSQFSIMRTAFSDNSSYYSLNGKRVQFKEVASKLRTHGVDLVHNRFLILQGEVEQIAMMKPKGPSEHESGMLEYLEDIIGTSRFKEPIEKLAEKVEELQQERIQKKERLTTAEKECNTLLEPMNKAIEFLQSENKITFKKNNLLQKTIYTAQATINEKTGEKKAIEEGMQQMVEDLKKFEEDRSSKEAEIEKLKSDLNDMIGKKDKLNGHYKKVNSQNSTLAEVITQLTNNKKKMIKNKKEEEYKFSELKSVPEKNKKDIVELEKLQIRLKADQEKEKVAVKKVLDSLQEETVGLQDEKEKQQTELLNLKKSVADLKSKYDLACSNMDIYVSTEQKEKAKLEQLKTTLANVSSVLEKRKKEVKEIEDKLPIEIDKLGKAEKEIVQVREDERVVNVKLQKTRLSMDEAKNAMQANKSRNKVLNYIMDKKRSGEIPGIIGRLGDLGAINSKYDVAISTACGPLDNIVVETVDTATRCVDYLKRENVGRATFICLENQEHFRNIYSQPFHTPENVPRLFDLIQVKDDRVLPAFYFAIRNTLVANDLEQASRIAYGRGDSGRHRVVTLDGEIIEVSGTMAGGGRQKLRGRMGQSIANVANTSMSAEELQAKEKALGEIEEMQRNLRGKAQELETTIITCRRNIEKWTIEKNKFSVELQTLENQEPEIQKQVAKQVQTVKEVEPDKAKVKEMNKLVDSSKKELDKAEEAAGVVEAKVNNLHQLIMDATGGRMKSAQKKLDEVNKKLNKITSEISKLTVGIQTAERNSVKSKEKIENLETELKESEAEFEEMKTQKKKLEEEASDLTRMLENITKSIEEKDEEKKELVKSVGNISKDELKIKTQKLMEDQKIEAIDAEIKQQKDRIPRIKNEIKQLKLHKIPKETEPLELKELSEEELLKLDDKKLMYQITSLENHLSKEKPNLSVIEEYMKLEEKVNQRKQELEEVTERRNNVMKWHDTARKSRLNEFLAGFTIINFKLKETYQMITLGGDAELELVDSIDPFSEGVIFSVRPPKKSWKNICNLSGGEKTLSSLALVFALHYYKPSPLYVMDEIDAALDFKNVSIVGHYIQERTKNAQFIIISLRCNMFELADRLVGIYKVNNCSQSATINTNAFVTDQIMNNDVINENNSKNIKNGRINSVTASQSDKNTPPIIEDVELNKSDGGKRRSVSPADSDTSFVDQRKRIRI